MPNVNIKTPNQTEVADFYGISQAHYNRLINGKREVSKAHAQRFSARTGLDWINYMKMSGTEIKSNLIDHMKNCHNRRKANRRTGLERRNSHQEGQQHNRRGEAAA